MIIWFGKKYQYDYFKKKLEKNKDGNLIWEGNIIIWFEKKI